MKVKIKYLLLVGLAVIQLSCRHNVSNKTDCKNNSIREILSDLLDDSKLPKGPKTICARFMCDISDSTFYKIVRVLKKNGFMDSIEDYDKLFKQYKDTIKLESVIDTSQYYYVPHNDKIKIDSNYDFAQLHSIFTVPVFYDNNKKCFIYQQDRFLLEHKTGQRFLIYENKDNKWIFKCWGILEMKIDSGYHKDFGFYINKKYLNNDLTLGVSD